MHCTELRTHVDLPILTRQVRGINSDELKTLAATLNPLWTEDYWEDVSLGVDALFGHFHATELLEQSTTVLNVCDTCADVTSSNHVALQEVGPRKRTRLIIHPTKNIKVLAVDIGAALGSTVDNGVLSDHRKLKCNECGLTAEPRQFMKPSLVATDLPRILIVRFDRSRSHSATQLLTYAVNIPLHVPSSAGTYQLIATAHIANYVTIGNHCYCFVRHVDGKWLKVDSGGIASAASVHEVEPATMFAAGTHLVEAYYLLVAPNQQSASVTSISSQFNNEQDDQDGPHSGPYSGHGDGVDADLGSGNSSTRDPFQPSRSCTVAGKGANGMDEVSGGSGARTGCSSALLLSDPSLGNQRLTPSSRQYALTPTNSSNRGYLLDGNDYSKKQYASI